MIVLALCLVIGGVVLAHALMDERDYRDDIIADEWAETGRYL